MLPYCEATKYHEYAGIYLILCETANVNGDMQLHQYPKGRHIDSATYRTASL